MANLINKAPEKIYLNPLLMEDGESIVRRCTFERQMDSQVEYSRTDAFIEKACKYIHERTGIPQRIESYEGEPLALSYIDYAQKRLEAADKMIEDFIKYMKGE